MKKLAILLQIIGLLAVCPIYVILEITHSTNEKSEVSSGSFVKPLTEIKSTKISTVPDKKTQSTPYYSITK
jgi:hypothetical protein